VSQLIRNGISFNPSEPRTVSAQIAVA